MKKLLGVSIAAMLAVTPMMANADSAVNARGVTTVTNNDVATNKNIATTSYVKGAFNVLATEVSNIGDDIAITQEQGETLNNISTGKTIAANVKDLDKVVGDKSELTSTKGALATDSNRADLVTAIVAINNALADSGSNSTVTTGSYVVNTNTVSQNLNALDTAIGQLNSQTTHNHITAMGTDANQARVATNLEALDSAIGKVQETTDEYAHLTGNASVAANLIELNNAVEANDADITTLKGSVSTAGSVLKSIHDNAKTAEFKAASGSSLSDGTISSAIEAVNTKVDTITGAATMEAGNYYAQGTAVKDAVSAVDTHVKTNENAIATINAKRIHLFGEWGNDDATQSVAISGLTDTVIPTIPN